MNFFTEHGIGSYEELVERCDAVSAASIRTRESLRDTEQRIDELSLLEKQIDTYRKLKTVYDRYKASKDKEKFLRGFESEVILFEAAAREIKKARLARLPSSEKLKAKLDELSARKTVLQTELARIDWATKSINPFKNEMNLEQKEVYSDRLAVIVHFFSHMEIYLDSSCYISVASFTRDLSYVCSGLIDL